MKCSFCGNPTETGTGKMLVKRDGTILYFCGPKCQKNQALPREPKNVKWTQTARKLKGKQ